MIGTFHTASTSVSGLARDLARNASIASRDLPALRYATSDDSRALAVPAHPDDADSGCAGTVADRVTEVVSREQVVGDRTDSQISRRSAAQRDSSYRLDICSLRSTLETCVSTVLMEMYSSRAISL